MRSRLGISFICNVEKLTSLRSKEQIIVNFLAKIFLLNCHFCEIL